MQSRNNISINNAILREARDSSIAGLSRKELISELLYGLNDDDLRTILEYKRMLWAVHLKQDMAVI